MGHKATYTCTLEALSEEEVAQQRVQFVALLESLGQVSYTEIEEILAEREAVEPEAGLSPEVVERLQKRLVAERQSA